MLTAGQAAVKGSWDAALQRGLRRARRGRAGRPSGVWSRLGDPTSDRPILRSTVEARPVPVRWGDDYVVVGDPGRRRHFRLEPWEWQLAQAMDGSRTVAELIGMHYELTGVVEPGAVNDLIHLLRSGDLLEGGRRDVWEVVEAAVAPAPTRAQRVRRLLTTLSVEWNGAEKLVSSIYRSALAPLFTPSLQPLFVLVSVVGLGCFAFLAATGRLTLASGSVASGLTVIVLSLAMTFVHELGHAAYLVHKGRRVYGAGFMLYFGSPAFFVDSTDGLLLDRRDRIRQAFAGPYYELVVGGVFAIAAVVTPPGTLADTLQIFVLLLYFGVFLNLIPLLELDGYWIFSELLETPTLRAQSFQFVRHDLLSRLARRAPLRLHEAGFVAYALIGTAFTVWSVWVAAVFWWALFGPMVSGLWNGGTLARLVLGVITIALAGPALQGLAALGRAVARRCRSALDDLTFKVQTGWRVEAALLLDDAPVFDGLPDEVLDDIAGRVSRRRISAGAAVFRQGDRADAFYIVRSGRLLVVDEGGGGDSETVLATLGRGDTFGELGLVSHPVRSATVRAAPDGDAEVFRIDEGHFDRLLRDDLRLPRFRPSLAELDELSSLPVFRHLSSARVASLRRSGEWVQVAPGTAVVREGQPGDAFYVIADGQAAVTQKRRTLRHLGAGDAFGELALQSGGPRTATVTALTPMRLFRIPPDAFRRFVRSDHGGRRPDAPGRRIMSH